jgi:hypothetical protein
MRRSGLLAGLVAAALGGGCLVQIDHVSDPYRAFERARTEALAVAGPGRPHELNVLAYDASERELVRVSLPLWLVRKAQGRIDWDGDHGREGDVRARVSERLRHLKWEEAGRGILMEAEEDGGEQVLIWLR